MVIYNNRIFELAAEIPPSRNEVLCAKSEKTSRLCGSSVSVSLSTNEIGNIDDFDIKVKACALGQASAGIFSKYAIGAGQEELIRAKTQLSNMLKNNGPAPDGRFWELRYLQSVADFPPRHASVMLVFDAACEAMDKIHTNNTINKET